MIYRFKSLKDKNAPVLEVDGREGARVRVLMASCGYSLQSTEGEPGEARQLTGEELERLDDGPGGRGWHALELARQANADAAGIGRKWADGGYQVYDGNEPSGSLKGVGAVTMETNVSGTQKRAPTTLTAKRKKPGRPPKKQ